ncbi:MAG TPA: hypothetical protein VFQ80_04930 [Thermomicrobiales bacterium]|jgi:hypothetical protein|nr:hypothetical protein [Thermomicrobiales bacterium]
MGGQQREFGALAPHFGRLAAASGLAALSLLMAPGLAPPTAAQDATPAAVTSDQGATTASSAQAATQTPAAAVGGATTSVPRAGVGPTAPADGDLASLLGVAAAAAAIAASLVRQRKPESGR